MDENDIFLDTCRRVSGLVFRGLEKVVDGFASQLVDDINRKIQERHSKNPVSAAPPARIENIFTRRINKEFLSELTNKYGVKGNVSCYIDENITIQYLNNELLRTYKWSKSARFKDLKSEKLISDIYINLDSYLIPLRDQAQTNERSHVIELTNAIENSTAHCIILGLPGAGKTTSMKKLCQIYSGENYRDEWIVISIRFRDLYETGEFSTLSKRILKCFGITGTAFLEKEGDFSYEFSLDILSYILNQIKVVIILDGFDELSSHKDKEKTISELKYLFRNVVNSKFIVTCRAGELDFLFENSDRFEIAPLDRQQIKDFVLKWLGDSSQAEKFISDIYNGPFADTAIRPINIAHFCALYERKIDISDKPGYIYDKIVSLLIDEWDLQRQVKRSSEFTSFNAKEKLKFLYHLAYKLTVLFKTSVFSLDQVLEAYNQTASKFDIPRNKPESVINELELHTGIFIKGGYRIFEFSHKSIQEYLTARYILELGSPLPVGVNASDLPDELAIATSLSTEPTIFMALIFVNHQYNHKLRNEFLGIYLRRLEMEKVKIAADECLALSIAHIHHYFPKETSRLSFIHDSVGSLFMAKISQYYEKQAKASGSNITLKKNRDHDFLNIAETLYVTDKLHNMMR